MCTAHVILLASSIPLHVKVVSIYSHTSIKDMFQWKRDAVIAPQGTGSKYGNIICDLVFLGRNSVHHVHQ